MRPIKFRAWDKDRKIMMYEIEKAYDTLGSMTNREGDIEYDYYDSSFGSCLKNSNYEIMQFTGLTDKNGKEIWEGDIVKTVLLDDELIGMVEYADQWGTFYLGITNKHGSRIALHTVFEWLYKEESDDIVAEVIGNIYENPELIKDTP